MSLLPGDLRVLQAMLRTRITEAPRLATIVEASVAEVTGSLARLEADGFVVHGDAGLVLPPPQRPLIDAARAGIAAQLATLEQAAQSLDALPGLLRDQAATAAGDQPEVPMEMTHGPSAIIDAWWRMLEQPRPVDVFVCFPEASTLVQIVAEGTRHPPQPGSRVQVIVGRSGVNEEARSAAAVLRAQGAEIRALDPMPGWGWMAGEGGELSAFPTTWGVAWPVSVRTLRDPIASQSLRALFGELWRRAQPIEEDPEEWEPVLRLLERGLDDAAVARELGVSERTVRRRVDEAMADLGATNRFTLGRAWAARR